MCYCFLWFDVWFWRAHLFEIGNKMWTNKNVSAGVESTKGKCEVLRNRNRITIGKEKPISHLTSVNYIPRVQLVMELLVFMLSSFYYLFAGFSVSSGMFMVYRVFHPIRVMIKSYIFVVFYLLNKYEYQIKNTENTQFIYLYTKYSLRLEFEWYPHVKHLLFTTSLRLAMNS